MSTHSSNGNVTIPERHRHYYISEADLEIIAGQAPNERALFRVHSYFFTRESNFFHRRVHPVSPGDTSQGTTSDPVMLDDTSPEDFATFLWVFYNPRYSIYNASVEQWRTILRLAVQWGFKEVKELAVRELHNKPSSELSLLDRLALFQEHRVESRHTIPLYTYFCQRDTSLTLEESQILGLDATVLIATTRERLRALPSNEGRSPLPAGVEDGDIYRALETQLKVEQGSTEGYLKAQGFVPFPKDISNPSQGQSTSSNARGWAAGGRGRGTGGKR